MADKVFIRQCGAAHQLYSYMMTDQREKRKNPRFAFLKISASAHLTHLQSHTSQPTAQALQKSQILPTLKNKVF
jgi:hypothetical protein